MVAASANGITVDVFVKYDISSNIFSSREIVFTIVGKELPEKCVVFTRRAQLEQLTLQSFLNCAKFKQYLHLLIFAQ